MQTLTWYWRRLRAMSPGEICWRLGTTLQESVDRCALAVREKPISLSRIADGNGAASQVDSAAIRSAWPGAFHSRDVPSESARWREAVVARADRLLDNRLSFFDLDNHDFGSEIDWNRECVSNKCAPLCFAPRVDYRDFTVTGDAKVAWEPNRHHHLVVLGRAYRLTGDRRYAEKVVEQIESWQRQCPYGRGMNWRSPLELAIRLINWAFSLEMISPSGVWTKQQMGRLLPVVYRHLWDITRKYSRHSSANNHLVGEAAGVFIATGYFTSLKMADAWRDRARDILIREMARQVHPDGGHCELATGYHGFVLELFLLAGIVARNRGEDFPEDYWKRLERMFDFLAALTEGGAAPPMFGDCDDGYVLDLGGGPDRLRGLMAVGATLFNRADFKAFSDGSGEPVLWLLGDAGCKALAEIDDLPVALEIRSRALPDSGYYLLQSGHVGRPDRISVAFDCGDLGYGPIAAHGHADALSFTLRAFGADVFVDPGTYDYFTYPKWRDYFRSTCAHNTIVIDEREQSETLGPFLWGRRAQARCVQWEPAEQGGTVAGEHDGYSRLDDPVVHRRTITLDGKRGEIVIRDELTGRTRHRACLLLHAAEHCEIRREDSNRFKVDFGVGTAWVHVDPCLSVSLVRGSEEPILGWVSRRYHGKQPAVTLRGCCEWTGVLTVETRIALERAMS